MKASFIHVRAYVCIKVALRGIVHGIGRSNWAWGRPIKKWVPRVPSVPCHARWLILVQCARSVANFNLGCKGWAVTSCRRKQGLTGSVWKRVVSPIFSFEDMILYYYEMRRPHIRSQLCMWLKSNSLRNKEKPQNTNRYAEAEKAFQSEKIDMSLVKKSYRFISYSVVCSICVFCEYVCNWLDTKTMFLPFQMFKYGTNAFAPIDCFFGNDSQTSYVNKSTISVLMPWELMVAF